AAECMATCLHYLELAEGNIKDHEIFLQLSLQLNYTNWIAVALQKIISSYRYQLHTNKQLDPLAPLLSIEINEELLKAEAEKDKRNIAARLLYIHYLIKHNRAEKVKALLSEPC